MQHRRRRKQRAAVLPGVKCVELARGSRGYGFTISGERPCALSCIVPGSAADEAGLREGDHLLAVNGHAVAQLSHDQVVRFVALSMPGAALKLLVAEGAPRGGADGVGSDTSDDGERPRRATSGHRSRMSGRLASSTVHSKRPAGSGRARSQSPGIALRQMAADAKRSGATVNAGIGSKPGVAFTIYNPTTAVGGRASDFGAARAVEWRDDVTDGGRTSPLPGVLLRSSSVPDVSPLRGPAEGNRRHAHNQLNLASSAIARGALKTGGNQGDKLGRTDSASSSASKHGPSFRVVVGYIGTIEIPYTESSVARAGGSSFSLQLQSIRGAVRRLRVEQKVHTLVALDIRADGVRLRGPSGTVVAHYATHTLAMSGMYPDDERFFGLVTVHGDGSRKSVDVDYNQDDGEDEDAPRSSCHVFLVDPALSTHDAHASRARQFGVHCTLDPTTQDCLEFPRSCAPVLRAIATLYRGCNGGTFEMPRAPTSRRGRRGERATSGSDTGSDSGLGRNSSGCNPMALPSEAYVVGVDIPAEVEDEDEESSLSTIYLAPVTSNAHGTRTLSVSAGTTAGVADRYSSCSSHSKALLNASHSGALVGTAACSAPVELRSSTKVTEMSLGNLVKGAAPVAVSPDVFNIRAMADPKALTAAGSANESPLTQQTAAESIRRNMQKFFEAKKTMVKDSHSLSDTESLASVRSTSSSFRPAPMSSSANSDSSRAALSSIEKVPSTVVTSRGTLFATAKRSASCETLSAPVPSPRGCLGDVSSGEASSAMPPPLPPKPHSKAGRLRPPELDRQPGYIGGGSSRLSPRAYPEVAARTPTTVTLSEGSAFEKVASTHVEERRGLTKTTAAAAAALSYQRPVPAPRNPVNMKSDTSASTSLRLHDLTIGLPLLGPAQDARCRSVPPHSVSAASGGAAVAAVAISAGLLAEKFSSVGPHIKFSSTLVQLSKRWARVGSLRKPREKRDELTYAESLTDPHGGTLGASPHRSVINVAADGTGRTVLNTGGDDIGRVTRWALGLDKLLQDEWGIATFTDFLKKEFSEENIAFWLACENYRKAQQSDKQKLAMEIFVNHLSSRGTQAVNIDGQARQQAENKLAAPTPNMFDEAQQQIFQLMKMDCYARFLKSDLYKSCIVAEMEGRRTNAPGTAGRTTAHKGFSNDAASEDSSDASDSRRRRSLFLFFKESARMIAKNSDTLTGKSRASDADTALKKQWSKSSGDSSVSEVVAGHATLRLTQSASKAAKVASYRDAMGQLTPSPRSAAAAGWRPAKTETPICRRIVLPDGSAVTTGAESADESVLSVVTRLCAESGLTMASVEVFAVGSDKPLDTSRRLSELSPSMDIIIERRAVFRLDLPNKKSVGVRAKPQRLIGDVLRPILHKYGYDLDDVVILQRGEPVRHDGIVSSIDSKRICVQLREDFAEWGGQSTPHRSLSVPPERNNRKRQTSLTDHTDSEGSNQHSGDSSSETSLDMVDFEKTALQERTRGSSLLSRLRPTAAVLSSEDRKGYKSKGKNKVHFAPGKTIATSDDLSSTKDDDGASLLELITKAQDTQYDDQRGSRVVVGELPAFLIQPLSNRTSSLSSAAEVRHPRGLTVESAVSSASVLASGKSTSDDHRTSGAASFGDSRASGKQRNNAHPLQENSYSFYERLSRSGMPSPVWKSSTSNTSHSSALPAVRDKRSADVIGSSDDDSTAVSYQLNAEADVSFGTDFRIPSHEEAESLFSTTHNCQHQAFVMAQQEDDDERTPTRFNQSYRAAVAIVKEAGSSSDLTMTDSSWYKAHWDSRDSGREECTGDENDAAVDEDEESPFNNTLTQAGAESSSLIGASYLPPPPAFENVDVTLADGARPGGPPPYNAAVARSAAYSAVRATAPSAGTSSRSSTLPGSRLSYANQPMIVDDDDGKNSQRFVTPHAFDSLTAERQSVQLPACDKLLLSGYTDYGVQLCALPGQGHTDSSDDTSSVALKERAVTLPEQYDFYQNVRDGRRYISHKPVHNLQSYSAIQEVSSKITFV